VARAVEYAKVRRGETTGICLTPGGCISRCGVWGLLQDRYSEANADKQTGDENEPLARDAVSGSRAPRPASAAPWPHFADRSAVGAPAGVAVAPVAALGATGATQNRG
jgi:hypothetical protein